MLGAFCIVALGVHIPLVDAPGCADFSGVDKEGCELNGNRASKILLPASVVTKCTSRLSSMKVLSQLRVPVGHAPSAGSRKESVPASSNFGSLPGNIGPVAASAPTPIIT